ncbi:unnamed protein product [Aureobasidium uvarum]|uniref:Apple domain-containing protein n=1 Tax=Aureobasidium uvarum TaxID=2773716 RepID=A0A9N8KMC9_9PEZI|nr:unnamed protein product [Aureobasidium uvarum]
MTTGSASATSSSSSSSVPLCPDTNGQSLVNRDSNAYTFKCASDSSTGSYSSAHPLHSYLDCMNLCDEAADSGCTAFTYVGISRGNGAGICYLKSSSGTFSAAADNYISGFLTVNNTSASSTTSSAVTASGSTSVLPLVSPSAELCPDAETQTFVTSQGGSLFFMRCSSDTNIGSYSNSKASASWKDCMNSCETDARCVAFTYVGPQGSSGSGQGVCWYKDTKGSATVAGRNYIAGFLAIKAVNSRSSGSSVSSIATGNLAVSSSSATTSSSTPSTSTASTSWATNSAGNNYTIYRGSDTNYGAYSNLPASNSFMDCTTACDKDSKCTAWTYVGGANGLGNGVCWLKYQLGQPVPSNSNNVISGSRLTQGVRMRRAVSSWWNSVTSVKTTATATKTQRVATSIPKPPPHPAWARYYPHGGRWMWNGHNDWEWVWN